MNDLRLKLAFAQDVVITGESFPARITIVNVGTTELPAPAEIGDADFEFTFSPLGGGTPFKVSRRALESAPQPGGREMLSAPPTLITKPLAGGEQRIVEVYPARLATRPIPAGNYHVTVSLLSSPAVVSAPARLKVEPPVYVAHHMTSSGPMAGSEVTFVHRDATGVAWLFGGIAPTTNPAKVAGLRIAQIAGAADEAQFAHAVHVADGRGPVMVAWLTSEGALFTAVAQTAYVVAQAGPIPLDIAQARLSPVGWKTGERFFAATFAALGVSGEGVCLLLVSVDRANKWVPQLKSWPLALPGLPALWRISQRAEGGYVVFAVYPNNSGSRLVSLAIDETGQSDGGLVEILATPQPVVALSTPLVWSAESTVQALSGPLPAEPGTQEKDRVTMAFHRLPLAGEGPSAIQITVPGPEGARPSHWSFAEGAPAVATLLARSATHAFAVRVREGIPTPAPVLLQPDAVSPSVLSIGPAAWLVWRNGTRSLESQPLPP